MSLIKYFCISLIVINCSAKASVGAGGIQPTPINPTLNSISITPGTMSLHQGFNQQFVATGTYSDATTTDISNTVTWSSSNTSTATISANGLVAGVSGGTTDITASLNGITSNTTTLTVTTLTTVTITPTPTTVPVLLTAQFTATGTYSDATTADISNKVAWTSNNGAIATVNSSGLASTMTTGGPVTITATDNATTVFGTASLTVTPAVLKSISITPTTASFINGTQQYTAIGSYDNNTTANITGTVTWNSSVPTTATINASGLATGVATGSTTISASINPVTSNNATLNVTMPTIITAPFPYAGTTTANATNYYKITGLAASTAYTIVMDTLSSNQNLTTYSNSVYTTSLCSPLATSTVTETCKVTSDAFGLIYFKVKDSSGIGGTFHLNVSGNGSLAYENGNAVAELTSPPTISQGTVGGGSRLDVTLSWDTEVGFFKVHIYPQNSLTGGIIAISASITPGTAGSGVLSVPIPVYVSSGSFQVIVDVATDQPTYNSGAGNYTEYSQSQDVVNGTNYYRTDFVSGFGGFYYNTSIAATTFNVSLGFPSATTPLNPGCGATIGGAIAVTSGALPSSFSNWTSGAGSDCFYIMTAPQANTVYYVVLDQFTVNHNLYTFNSGFVGSAICNSVNGGTIPEMCGVSSDPSGKIFIRISAWISGGSFRLTLQ